MVPRAPHSWGKGQDDISPPQSPRTPLRGNETDQVDRSVWWNGVGVHFQSRLQQRSTSLCVTLFSDAPQKTFGAFSIPNSQREKLKLREGKALAQRYRAGKWLCLNSDLLFLVCGAKWPLHPVGAWYMFAEGKSELMNHPRSRAGHSSAGT